MTTYHVYPVNDLRDHVTEGKDCWCRPRVDVEERGEVVVHNAMDQRERYETGELLPQ